MQLAVLVRDLRVLDVPAALRLLDHHALVHLAPVVPHALLPALHAELHHVRVVPPVLPLVPHARVRLALGVQPAGASSQCTRWYNSRRTSHSNCQEAIRNTKLFNNNSSHYMNCGRCREPVLPESSIQLRRKPLRPNSSRAANPFRIRAAPLQRQSWMLAPALPFKRNFHLHFF